MHILQQFKEDVVKVSTNVLNGTPTTNDIKPLKMLYDYKFNLISSEFILTLLTPHNVNHQQQQSTLLSSSTTSKDFNLERIVKFLSIGNSMRNNEELMVGLDNISKQLNRERFFFYQKHEQLKSKNPDEQFNIDECWNYLSLLNLVNEYFYNDTTQFAFSDKSRENVISSDLFLFEYFMALLTQAVTFIHFANKSTQLKSYSKAVTLFNKAIEIIDYIIQYLDGDIENSNYVHGIDKFLFVQSPSFFSSSHPKTTTSSQSDGFKPVSNVTPNIAQKDLDTIMMYFGGQESFRLIKHLLCAKREEICYTFALTKLNIINDCDFKSIKENIHSNVGNGDITYNDYFELTQLSKSILVHYEEGFRIISNTLHFKLDPKTRIYYFTLFMKHYWFCKHHFMISLIDSVIYEREYDSKYAQLSLTRIIVVLKEYNSFLAFALYNTEENNDSSSVKSNIYSNIISDSILQPYLDLRNSIMLFYTIINRIVTEVCVKKALQPNELLVIQPIIVPHKFLKIHEFLKEILIKNSLSTSILTTKLQKLKQFYCKLPIEEEEEEKIYDKNEEEEEKYDSISVRKKDANSKFATLEERLDWLNCLINKLDKSTMTITIQKEETRLIYMEREKVQNSIRLNLQGL
jgi:hypothetical protein